MVPKKPLSFIRRWQFHKYVVFQERRFYKIHIGNYQSKMVLQNCLYLLRSSMVLQLNRHCLFTFFHLFTMRDIFFSFFFFLASYRKDAPSISLSSLSLYRLGRCPRFGGAAVAPPPKAPHEGSALEVIAGGGGGFSVVVLCHQICYLAAFSRRWSLHWQKLDVHSIAEANGRRGC